MKKHLKTWFLPLLVLACGILGALLQLWCLSTADDKGLLLQGHISQVLTWILTAGVLGAVFYFTRPLVQAAKYSFNFPASLISGLGSTVGAVGILVSSIGMLLHQGDTLSLAAAIVSLLAAAALALSGYGRLHGKRMNVLLHCTVCVYFLLLLICQYRQWSAVPQLQLYAFSLLATVFLALGTFQRACFDGWMGKRQAYAFFRLAGVYFCLAALPGAENWLLYLCCAVWSVTDLCNLTPIQGKGR